ncbi:MAG: serpin family protein [Nocardioidaceae bacterium]|nr:serpin family protein [Nocardioidaceae bacterium]
MSVGGSNRVIATVTALGALILAACGSEPTVTETPAGTTLAVSDLQRATPAPDTPVDEAARGLQTFGYQLIRENPQLIEDGNLVVSPASIGVAFAMARAGARGQTATQIDAVLHFPDKGLGDAYNALTRGWTSRGGKDAPQLSVANAIFAQNGFALEPDYLDTLARDFGAGVRQVDFADGSAADVINAWVKTETRDRIDKLFNDLDPATQLVLANAVYLKATWERQFLADLTRPVPFHRADGTVVRPETMSHHEPERYEYAATAKWSAVRMPYLGEELAMWVLLPTARDGDPVALLEPAVLTTAMDRARGQRVDLSLPKWDFQSDLPLNDPLTRMGMSVPFSAMADFSGISPAGLHIDQAVHRAGITVDEKGTEAAAVTGIGFVVSAGPSPDVSMTVDHPFAFAIVHEPSGAPLFEGVVGDPTAIQ